MKRVFVVLKRDVNRRAKLQGHMSLFLREGLSFKPERIKEGPL